MNFAYPNDRTYSARRRGGLLLGSLAVGTLVLTAIAAPAHAAATLNVTLSQVTGTVPFDADSAPGHDPSASDSIVRTNDTVAYTVGIRYEGDENQTDPVISFTLPAGEELVSLPPFCLTGSAVVPATVGSPILPVTSTSYLSLPSQTISCRVADQNVGTALDYTFTARVRSEVPHGTTLGPITASASSEQVATPAVSGSVSHSVTAAPTYDLSKRNTSTTANAGPLYQSTQPCVSDPSRGCAFVAYPLSITAANNGKGISPLVSTSANPITFTDDLSPDVLFGPGTTTSAAWTASADPFAEYGARIVSCATLTATGNFLPGSSGGGANDVRNSGTVTCPQPGGPGTPVNVSIVGADMTAYTTPTRSDNDQAALAADLAYVVSVALLIEIPIDAVMDLGTTSPGTWTLNWSNTFSELEGVDAAGQENVDPNAANNTRIGQSIIRTTGSFDKFFTGVTGNPNNTPGSTYSLNIFDGPPGSGVKHDGNTVVLPGQTVMSTLNYTQYRPPGTGTTFSKSTLLCDAWDPDAFALAPGNYQGFINRIPSNGDAVWPWAFYYNGAYQTTTAELDNFTIQYSSGAFGNGATSTCDTGTWYDDPGSVPGATLNPDGTYSGVNRVRVTITDKAAPAAEVYLLAINIALRVLDTYEVGDELPNYAAQKSTPGVLTPEQIIASPQAWDLSLYDYEANTGLFGDRLILGAALARLNKEVRNPSTGEFTSTAVPQYTAGNTVDYRLTPTLTADVAAGVFAEVSVEDCLPAYQQFVSSARGSGAAIAPSAVSEGSPSGAGLTCAAGETYLRWDLGLVEIGAPVDPIIYTVEVLGTVRNGTYTNTALVTADGDPSVPTLRDDTAQIQVVVPTGIKISKSTPQSSIELNPAGVTTPRQLVWDVEFANVDSPVSVSDVDVIDVLPSDGIGGSSFEGDVTLTSAAVTTGTGIQILYTSADSASLSVDPLNVTNGAAGATVWCDAASAGTAVSGSGTTADCPAGIDEVTGLRLLRAGAFLPEDAFTVRITMTPSENRGDDLYINVTSGRADGVSQQVGPASRAIAIIESEIGDFVWEDLNANGIQDAGEPGIAGFPVTISGTDLDGNPVSRSTVTDADGYYEFDGLASGSYEVTFDPSALDSNSTFSPQNQGSDDAIDSDGDPVTGRTGPITLPADTVDNTWDQGIIIDRNVQISVDKQLISQTELDDERRATVVYEIDVVNAGTADTEYDLEDEILFGGGITVEDSTVENFDPGDITTNPSWDGSTDTVIVTDEPLDGGESHTYRVVVEVLLSTTITSSQADCVLTTDETGTGYLNAAILTFDGQTVDDSDCEEPPLPPVTPPALGLTGGSAPVLGTVAAMLLLAAGALLIAVRRRGRAA